MSHHPQHHQHHSTIVSISVIITARFILISILDQKDYDGDDDGHHDVDDDEKEDETDGDHQHYLTTASIVLKKGTMGVGMGLKRILLFSTNTRVRYFRNS